jgi:hypothetical protein
MKSFWSDNGSPDETAYLSSVIRSNWRTRPHDELSHSDKSEAAPTTPFGNRTHPRVERPSL